MRGIISNGEIWLWNLRRMNDSQEMQYFIKELKAEVVRLLSEKKAEDVSLKVQGYFDENLRDFAKISSYAACFSEYSDDAAQWARYAKNGMGVCIAFDASLLSKIGDAGHAPLCKVNYSCASGDMEIAKELSDLIFQGCDETSDEVRELFSRLISSSPLFKHPSFISEKEYRLVSMPCSTGSCLGQPRFFVEENNIKKYYALNLKKVCENLQIDYQELFVQVCIGPQARVTEDVLADYFESTGMAALCKKIKVSECPLRRF